MPTLGHYGHLHNFLSRLNIRDKAFVLVQYESGARTGEVLNAKLCDVEFNEQGDFIRFHGLKNTPDRVIQLVEAGFYLKEWITCHPAGGNPFNVKDPNAPLWVKMEQFSCKHCGKCKRHHTKNNSCSGFEPLEMESVTHANIFKSFQIACGRAGIRKKRYRLYNLRHSRITKVASFLSHEQMCKFAGWKPGSGQFHVYVHLDSEDVNKAIRAKYNLGQEIKKEPVVCKICWHQNEPGSIQCLKCRRPLTVEATYKVDQVKDALKVLVELQENGKLEELVKMAHSLQ